MVGEKRMRIGDVMCPCPSLVHCEGQLKLKRITYNFSCDKKNCECTAKLEAD